MFAVRNLKLRGATVITSYGPLYFDDQGIAVVQNAELYKKLLEVPGFEPVYEAPLDTQATANFTTDAHADAEQGEVEFTTALDDDTVKSSRKRPSRSRTLQDEER